jgi:hypothetical protein
MGTNRIPKQAIQYRRKNTELPWKRIKEQEARLTLHEHEHDDDDDDEE